MHLSSFINDSKILDEYPLHDAVLQTPATNRITAHLQLRFDIFFIHPPQLKLLVSAVFLF